MSSVGGGEPVERLHERRPALVLALMLWGLVLVAHLLFTLSVGADPQLLVLPFFWVLLGLILTKASTN